MKASVLNSIALTTLVLSSAAATSALALEVNSDNSRVNVVSTKVLADGTASATEIFSFNSLSGSVGDDGAAMVSIDLGTIDTGIDIRNERMGEHFFEVGTYPSASVTAQIPDSALEDGNHIMDLDVSLDLHGSQMEYTVPVLVSSSEKTVSVVSTQPVLVDASSFELQGGLAKLAELAGLMHIPTTVPVTFDLKFDK